MTSRIPRPFRSGAGFGPAVLPWACVALWLTLPAPSRAQSVVGKLVEAAGGAPIPGAMVRLLDSDSTRAERAWTLSGPDGGFHLDSLAPGRYQLEVERIGFETWRSGPLEVPGSGILRRTFRIPVRPVELGGIRVEGKSRGECRIRSQEGPALAAVWSEVRKALERTDRTHARAGDRFRLRRYERFLDRDLRVVKESGTSGTKVGHATYRSVPVDTLVKRGFASTAPGGGLDVHAPDAPVLLSDAFGTTHCFRLVAAPDSERGQVGLAFTPVRDRKVPEVEGTLWVDTATAHLRSLTFRYVHLGEPYPDSLAHGRLDYRALPDGEWVVDRWWIRLPSVVERRILAGRSPSPDLLYGDQVAYDVSTWQEFGGELVGARTAGRVTIAPHQGQVGGTVYDSVGGRPVPDVPVRIRGTDLGTRTDEEGRFLFPDVTPGRYRIVAEGVGRDSAVADVEVAADGVQLVDLAGGSAGRPGPEVDSSGPATGATAAARATTAASTSPITEARGGSADSGDVADALARRLRAEAGVSVRDTTGPFSAGGTLIGTVKAADTGEPLEGAVLEVAGSRMSATTTASGHFRLDGLPSGAVRVTARYLGYASDTVRLALQAGALTVADFRLATKAIPVRELTVQVRRSIRNAQVKAFYERMERHVGGQFADRQEVERYGLRGALERMPHVHIQSVPCTGGQRAAYFVGCKSITVARGSGEMSLPSPQGGSAAPGAPACQPTFYVDGQRVSRDQFVDLMSSLPADAVEGVEVHEASNVPVQFGGSGIGGCGVVMLWTHTLAGADEPAAEGGSSSGG